MEEPNQETREIDHPVGGSDMPAQSKVNSHPTVKNTTKRRGRPPTRNRLVKKSTLHSQVKDPPKLSGTRQTTTSVQPAEDIPAQSKNSIHQTSGASALLRQTVNESAETMSKRQTRKQKQDNPEHEPCGQKKKTYWILYNELTKENKIEQFTHSTG